MKKKFSKQDLVTGMVAETVGGDRLLVSGDIFMGKSFYKERRDYKNTLKHNWDNNYDIIKVYTCKNWSLDSIFNDEDLEVIWDYRLLTLLTKTEKFIIKDFIDILNKYSEVEILTVAKVETDFENVCFLRFVYYDYSNRGNSEECIFETPVFKTENVFPKMQVLVPYSLDDLNLDDVLSVA